MTMVRNITFGLALSVLLTYGLGGVLATVLEITGHYGPCSYDVARMCVKVF